MKTYILAAFLLFGWFAGVRAQENAMAVKVKEQAMKMHLAMVAGDFKTYVHFVHPAVVRQAGGEEAMEKGVAGATASMKERGMSFGKYSLGEVSKIWKGGPEFQCTVFNELEIKVSGMTIVSKSTLVAISGDGGKNWTFVDNTGRSMASVRRLLPNLNPAIVFADSDMKMNKN